MKKEIFPPGINIPVILILLTALVLFLMNEMHLWKKVTLAFELQ